MNANTPYANVKINEWNAVLLPGAAQPIQVWYMGRPRFKALQLFKLLKNTSVDFLYVNGLYTGALTVPLFLRMIGFIQNTKIIIAPRGMLQEGALSVKPKKKKLYLTFLKLTGMVRGLRWHATDAQEKEDILRNFGNHAAVVIASNIPKQPVPWKEKVKESGKLRLVFLSLITEKKNLHIALDALHLIKTPISFHIYGPVKDQRYWEKCLVLMKDQIHEIEYFGSVNAHEVQNKLAGYDAMILPTKGENFGHAIYEALSVGTPVMVSPYTPWGRLQDFNAGITIDTFNKEDWAKAIQKFVDINQEDYLTYSKDAYALAQDYFSKNDFKAQYQNLFS